MVSGLDQLRTDHRALLAAQQGIGYTGQVPLARPRTLAKEWMRLGGAVQAGETSEQLRSVLSYGGAFIITWLMLTLLKLVNALKTLYEYKWLVSDGGEDFV